MDFPPIKREVPGFVYIFYWLRGTEEGPFYVGQTSRIWGRLDDYYWAMFSAPTDFRVGEAVRYLATKGYRVVVKYRPSADPRGEESEIIRGLHSIPRKLLNDIREFDLQKPDESAERLRVQQFLDSLLPK